MGSFYLGLACSGSLLIGAGFLVIGRRIRRWSAISAIRSLLAFSTASSEAAYPRTLEALDRFGVPRADRAASCCRSAIRSISTAR